MPQSPGLFYQVHFYLFGLLAIASALAFVTRKSPVAAALWLVSVMFNLAALYVMMDAHFVGAIQVLVYAGAIMVLFLFVIMLVNLRDSEHEGLRLNPLMVLAAGTFLALMTRAVQDLGPAVGSQPNALEGSPGLLADTLFTRYVVPFEAVSLLLLAAILGTVVLARRKEDA